MKARQHTADMPKERLIVLMLIRRMRSVRAAWRHFQARGFPGESYMRAMYEEAYDACMQARCILYGEEP